MKKMIYAVLPFAALLTACSTTPPVGTAKVGIANPASEYCQKIGGQLSIQKDAQGNETGICTLPNGQQVEEWDLYRKSNPQ